MAQEEGHFVPLQASVLLRPPEAAPAGYVGCCPAWLLTVPHLPPQDLREKNWKAMEALASSERAFEEKLRSLTQAKVSASLRQA